MLKTPERFISRLKGNKSETGQNPAENPPWMLNDYKPKMAVAPSWQKVQQSFSSSSFLTGYVGLLLSFYNLK